MRFSHDCGAYNRNMRIRRTLAVFAMALSLASLAAATLDPTVYVTSKGGKKYHRKNCRLKHGSLGIKLSLAKKRGFLACKVCKPPK